MSRRRADPAGEAAIGWRVRLGAASPSPQLRRAFDAWLAEDPAHRAAWERLQQRLGGALDPLRQRGPASAGAARDALLANPGRRDLLRGLAAVALAGGGLWLGSASAPGQRWLADLSTGTGERRRIALADGSLLTLDAESAVDLDTSGRQARLRRGALAVDIAEGDPRPFVVVVAQGRASALRGRLLVRQQAEGAEIAMLGGACEIVAAGGGRLALGDGERACLRPDGGLARLDGAGQDDWLEGRLSVIDATLAGVIDALRPYRSDHLRVHPAVRAIRVQGVFSLDDSDATLAALAEILPIRIRRYGRWLTLVEPRTASG